MHPCNYWQTLKQAHKYFNKCSSCSSLLSLELTLHQLPYWLPYSLRVQTSLSLYPFETQTNRKERVKLVSNKWERMFKRRSKKMIWAESEQEEKKSKGNEDFKNNRSYLQSRSWIVIAGVRLKEFHKWRLHSWACRSLTQRFCSKT